MLEAKLQPWLSDRTLDLWAVIHGFVSTKVSVIGKEARLTLICS